MAKCVSGANCALHCSHLNKSKATNKSTGVLLVESASKRSLTCPSVSVSVASSRSNPLLSKWFWTALPAKRPVNYCCFLMITPLCRCCHGQAFHDQQQRCGNVDGELLDIDPPTLGMLRSVINDDKLPNIAQVRKQVARLQGKMKGYSTFAKVDLPYWGLRSGRQCQPDVQAPPGARCLPRTRRSSSSGYLTFSCFD